MVHRVLAFAVEYVQIDADNLRISYLQEREPGPLPNPRSHLEGRDGAEMVIRRLLLLPDSKGGSLSALGFFLFDLSEPISGPFGDSMSVAARPMRWGMSRQTKGQQLDSPQGRTFHPTYLTGRARKITWGNLGRPKEKK